MNLAGSTKARWGTRFGFYLAAVGSAFGLGNLWRFPYVVEENGGGAFVFVYLLFVFVLGMPLLVGELLLGKVTKKSLLALSLNEAIGPSKKSLRKVLVLAGPLSILVVLIVLSYFSVITGWVLISLMEFLKVLFSGEVLTSQSVVIDYSRAGWSIFGFTMFHLFVVGFVMLRDVEEGIERWIGRLMPLFAILLVVLVTQSLSLKSAPEAIRFLFYPDFSSFSAHSVGAAVGHMLFSLSLGFGTLVTFGSYLETRTPIPVAGFRVVLLDCFVSIFSGLMIFPMVFYAGGEQSGVVLLFQAVPELLSRVNNGLWIGIGFYLCLYLAALGASIGLLETLVANLRDGLGWSRRRSALISCLAPFFLVAPIIYLNTGYFDFQWGFSSWLYVIDQVMVNWVLPILVLMMIIVIYLRVDLQRVSDEFELGEPKFARRVFKLWKALFFIGVPSVILLGLLLQLI